MPGVTIEMVPDLQLSMVHDPTWRNVCREWEPLFPLYYKQICAPTLHNAIATSDKMGVVVFKDFRIDTLFPGVVTVRAQCVNISPEVSCPGYYLNFHLESPPTKLTMKDFDMETFSVSIM